MTDPVKKDDHAKKDEHAKADDHAKKPEKKSISGKVWGAVAFVVVVGVGLIVLFTLGGPIFTQALDAFNSALQSVFTSAISAVTNFGVGMSDFLKASSKSLSKMIMAAVQLVILPVILFFIGKKIWEIATDKKDGSH